MSKFKALVESILAEDNLESIERSPELITKLEEMSLLRPVIHEMETAWEKSNDGPSWMAVDNELEAYLNGSIDVDVLCDYVASATADESDPFDPWWFDTVKFEQAVQEIIKKALSGSLNQ